MNLRLLISMIIPAICLSQVGIHTNDPQFTLDVQGTARIDESVFLENPGENDDIRNSLLLLRRTNGSVAQYDIDISKYGPINYSQYIFRNVGIDGLQDFDTKININDYTVTVQGFFFLNGNDDQPNDTNVLVESDLDGDNIEGFQFYAYKNNSTNTWFLRAFLNNSRFQGKYNGGEDYFDTVVDIYLNVVIYRQRLITKTPTNSVITVDMGNSETAVAPLPAGF